MQCLQPFLCLSACNAAKPNDVTCSLPPPTALQTTAVLHKVAVTCISKSEKDRLQLMANYMFVLALYAWCIAERPCSWSEPI